MSGEVCRIEGCDLPIYAKKTRLCSRHYGRLLRHGDPLGGTPPTTEGRFWALVDRRGAAECWPWKGYTTPHRGGYGYFAADYKNHRAHRYAYELLVGPIPEGLVLDHLCRNTACVNPAHLEPVTDEVNILRGTSRAAMNARKTHCIHGHEFTPENTSISWSPKGQRRRRCRTCNRMRAWSDERRAAQA